MSAVDAGVWRSAQYSFTASDGACIRFSDTGSHTPPYLRLRGHDTTVLLLQNPARRSEQWDWIAWHLYERDPELRIVALDERHGGRFGTAASAAVRVAGDIAEFVASQIPSGRVLLIGWPPAAAIMTTLEAVAPEIVAQRISAVMCIGGPSRYGLPTLAALRSLSGSARTAARAMSLRPRRSRTGQRASAGGQQGSMPHYLGRWRLPAGHGAPAGWHTAKQVEDFVCLLLAKIDEAAT